MNNIIKHEYDPVEGMIQAESEGKAASQWQEDDY